MCVCVYMLGHKAESNEFNVLMSAVGGVHQVSVTTGLVAFLYTRLSASDWQRGLRPA